jgi:hypothetical protein
MYVNNRTYNDAYNDAVRQLTKKEIILMAKQLGMMHILYAAKRDFWDLQNKLKAFSHNTPEFHVLRLLGTRRDFFITMDRWEKRYKIDGRAFGR